MKKCLFYLFAMLCSMSFFSCGDDKGKDGIEEPDADEYWKLIASDYTGDRLKLNFNGKEVTTNAIKLETISAEKGSVTLAGNLIANAPDLKVDVTLKTTKAEMIALPTFAIEGQTQVDSRTITVKGAVTLGVLSLNVDVKVASPIVGKWGLAPESPLTDLNEDGRIDENDYNPMTGCFFLSLETKTGSITFSGQTIPDKQFRAYADQKAEAFLRASLSEISFLENGTIVFYKRVNESTNMPIEGLAGYYVKDNMLYMTLDIISIMKVIGSKAEYNPLDEVLTLAQNGIPLAYIPSEDGKSCSLLINKEMATALIPKLTPVFKILPGMIKDPEILAMIGQISGLLEQIVQSNGFSVGLNLVKK